LALQRPLICGNCGTESLRAGKYIPAMIAVAALLLFHQMTGMYAFTFIGTALLLVAIVFLAMMIDEATIRLVPRRTRPGPPAPDRAPDRAPDPTPNPTPGPDDP